MAGFFANGGSYFVARSSCEPPLSLRAQIWPWIEDWADRFRKRAARKAWGEGGLDGDDQAGQGFIKLLQHLRTVLLQDAAVLQPGRSLF